MVTAGLSLSLAVSFVFCATDAVRVEPVVHKSLAAYKSAIQKHGLASASALQAQYAYTEALFSSTSPAMPVFLTELTRILHFRYDVFDERGDAYNRLMREWQKRVSTSRDPAIGEFYAALHHLLRNHSSRRLDLEQIEVNLRYIRTINDPRTRALWLFIYAGEYDDAAARSVQHLAVPLYREIVDLVPGTYLAAEAEKGLTANPLFAQQRWREWRTALQALKGKYPNFEFPPGDPWGCYYEMIDHVDEAYIRQRELLTPPSVPSP